MASMMARMPKMSLRIPDLPTLKDYGTGFLSRDLGDPDILSFTQKPGISSN